MAGLIGTQGGPSRRQNPPAPGTLRVMPLGGVGEFGKNCLALEYGKDMIIIDCGQKFPEDDMFGIDLVIPDFSYIVEHADRLRGIVLTHGHEDHIGGLPHLIRQLGTSRIPIYGSRLTLALVTAKLFELEPDYEPILMPVEGFERGKMGVFDVEFLPVSHSMPHAMALVIETPIGRLFHTGDYKLECEGANGSPLPAPFQRLDLNDPFLLLMADSTNVDREGFAPTEDQVREGLDPILSAAQGTVIMATFSSSLYRVQTGLDLAIKTGRKVAVCGLSLERNFAIATELGLIHYPDYLVRPLAEVVRLPPRQRLLLFTGTQGEPESALARLSRNAFKGYRITEGDTVILSSRIIPGNEKPIWRMINNFYRHGGRVITERDARVHGSGHACRGEMRRLIDIIRPGYFMPVHGEMRQLIIHRELAVECGVPADRVLVFENGTQLELAKSGATLTPTDWAGQVLVDGRSMGGVEEVVLRDRKYLSEDGIVTVILVIDQHTHKIIAGPDIVSRGFVSVEENESLLDDCRRVVTEAFEECDVESQEQWDVVKTAVRKALRRHLTEATDRFPVILPVVVEV
ncbi:ribonuclease J [bacterium]|nr:ribonuclease J [bacterium]